MAAMLRCFSSTTEVVHSFLVVVLWITQVWFISIEAAITEHRHHTCEQKALPCLLFQMGMAMHHSCLRDVDCLPGRRCCFRGCRRTCVLWDPCQTVICSAGYTCQNRYSNRSIPEADCVPDEKRLCKPLNCDNSKRCPAGFKHKLNREGCPTCQCELKNDCKLSGCRILCAYGLETGLDGCPVCRCKKAPESPCSDLLCQADEQCRLVAPSDCSSHPCHPTPQCVPRPVFLTLFDNTCSSWDPSTVHLPVVSRSCPGSHSQNDSSSSSEGDPSGVCELECHHQTCPARTVCVKMGSVQSRCCWQGTQALVLPPAKQGECPPDILVEVASAVRTSRRPPHQRCQLDAQCPGQQKCCSRARSATTGDNISNRDGEDGLLGKTISVSGLCTDPTHQILGDITMTAKVTPP